MEFTISSTFSGLTKTLAEFEKYDIMLSGLTTVNATYTDWETGELERIPAFRMVVLGTFEVPVEEEEEVEDFTTYIPTEEEIEKDIKDHLDEDWDGYYDSIDPYLVASVMSYEQHLDLANSTEFVERIKGVLERLDKLPRWEMWNSRKLWDGSISGGRVVETYV